MAGLRVHISLLWPIKRLANYLIWISINYNCLNYLINLLRHQHAWWITTLYPHGRHDEDIFLIKNWCAATLFLLGQNLLSAKTKLHCTIHCKCNTVIYCLIFFTFESLLVCWLLVVKQWTKHKKTKTNNATSSKQS